jgi:crotonobetainyl-CoA:carnitine CoA-transferase CaiB-like acyl-CoA transferase
VVKIELPGGDYSRSFDPPGWASINRGKEGLTLNLRPAEGREVMMRLAARADVVVEGFRPGVMDRLGVGYEALRQVQPRLVYCSISGFGQDGDQRLRAGHGLNYAGVAGMVDFAGDSSMLIGLASDLSSSLYAAIAILAALRYRDGSGQGQHIDLSITDTTYALMTEHLAGGHGEQQQRQPSGTFGVFIGADGRPFTLAAVEDQFWIALCAVLERPDWATNPQYADDAGRHRYAAEIRAQLAGAFAERPTSEWLDRLEQAGVPAGPVNNLGQATRDPYAVSRELVAWVPQDDVGLVAQVQFPARFSEIERAPVSVAPTAGEHTESLLSELGYSADERAALRRAGVV